MLLCVVHQHMQLMIDDVESLNILFWCTIMCSATGWCTKFCSRFSNCWANTSCPSRQALVSSHRANSRPGQSHGSVGRTSGTEGKTWHWSVLKASTIFFNFGIINRGIKGKGSLLCLIYFTSAVVNSWRHFRRWLRPLWQDCIRKGEFFKESRFSQSWI